MQARKSRIVIALTVVCIALQIIIWYAWNNGALDSLVSVYQSFGLSIPPALSFGLRSMTIWWVAPLSNALLATAFWFSNNRSHWLFAPLVCSFASAAAMVYIMYSEPLAVYPLILAGQE